MNSLRAFPVVALRTFECGGVRVEKGARFPLSATSIAVLRESSCVALADSKDLVAVNADRHSVVANEMRTLSATLNLDTPFVELARTMRRG